MSVTASGLFVATFADILDTTQLAVDLDLETHKGALFSNAITPNFVTDTAYGVGTYATNEVSGTGWAAGGVALVGTTFDVASIGGTLVYDATDVSVASTTLTNARCYLLYADALAGNNAIVLVNFGADFSTVNGTFGIQWAAPASGGVFNIDLTP
jgi:hypothetical protein